MTSTDRGIPLALDTIADLIYTALESPTQIGSARELEVWVCALMAAWDAIAFDSSWWQWFWRESCKTAGATSSQSLSDKYDTCEVVDHLKKIFKRLRTEYLKRLWRESHKAAAETTLFMESKE